MKIPKLSRLTKVGIAALGVLFIAWMGLTFFAESESKRTEAVVTEQKRCPTCSRPLSQTAIERNVCPYCLLEQGEEAAAQETDADIEEKFRALTEDYLGAQRVNLILERLWHLEDVENVAEIPPTLVIC